LRAVICAGVIALCLGFCTATFPASAQSFLEVLAGVKFCRTLTDDGQRLKCFDGLFAEKPVPDKVEKKEVAWEITENKSPIDDSPQVTATLLPPGSDTSVDLFSAAVLILRCKEKETDAMFKKLGSYLGSHDKIRVLVRIGDGKPIETMWTPSTDGGAAFAPSAIQFIRALPDRGKLFIRAFGYRGPADGEFDLANVSDARERIAKACKWDAIKPPQHSPAVKPAPTPK
jgi:hypothetical protein